jgi:hypothetical protein
MPLSPPALSLSPCMPPSGVRTRKARWVEVEYLDGFAILHQLPHQMIAQKP